MKTTYYYRFHVALTLLTGAVPPEGYVLQWLSNEDDYPFQSWAASNGPSWAQGLAILDAAHAMADSPCEGEGHESRLTDEQYKEKL